ncbi:2-succinyl-5-enolpyruvyl-6-hydroxy-3-cyclohexene-1-carboxylic-acid synthase [Microbacterium sp. NPDC055903]
MSASPATDAAATLLAALIEHGVQDVVLSPGSRSQALALAASGYAAQGALRLHVRIDERVAGFTALGLGRELGAPAVVVCTSGTAAANLLPAAMEAFHAGVPLILLTADRPPELRGVGANQATAQPGMFEPWARLSVDAPTPEPGDAIDWADLGARAVAVAMGAESADARAGIRGPVHLNLPYREPLSDAADGEQAPAVRGAAPSPASEAPLVVPRGPRTVVIAGADAGSDAEQLAHEGGWPLIAEIVSGARFGRNIVNGYRELLRMAELGGRIERALVFGHPTLSREVTGLLRRGDVEVIAVRRGGEALDLNGRTRDVPALAVEAGERDSAWLGAWLTASSRAAVDLSETAPDAEGLASKDAGERRDAVRGELAAIRRPLDRELLVDAVWRATWPHDRLVFGSSRLVRVADAVLGGKKVPVHANRGLAGIDGTIATATGIAIAGQAGGAPGVTRLVLGDLTMLHDVGALLLPPDEDEPRIQVIVGNDGGGTIFDSLEVAASASASDLDRAFYTPHTVRLEHLALAYGWEYQRVTTRAALDQVLTRPVGGRQLIEVPLAR